MDPTHANYISYLELRALSNSLDMRSVSLGKKLPSKTLSPSAGGHRRLLRRVAMKYNQVEAVSAIIVIVYLRFYCEVEKINKKTSYVLFTYIATFQRERENRLSLSPYCKFQKKLILWS